MNRRLAVIFAVPLLLVLGLSSGSASAHVLKSDGTIGGMLHIQPDDNPTSGHPTTYELDFSDTAGRFDLGQCDCRATVQENGKTIGSQPIVVTSSKVSVNSFTFPKADVYNLIVSGKSKKAGLFSNFTLNYLLRVEPGTDSASAYLAGDTNQPSSYRQPFPRLMWVGLTMMIALILLGAYASERKSAANGFMHDNNSV